MSQASAATNKPARVQFAFMVDPSLLDSLDLWRERQDIPPSRAAAMRWILEQYLAQALTPKRTPRKRAN